MSETVRIARKEDYDAIWALLRPAYDDEGILPLSEARARETIKRCLDADQGGAVSVACQDGRIVGSIGMMISQPCWYSDAWALTDLWMFVHPDYRASRHAKTLLLEADAAAKRLRLPLFPTVTGEERLEGKHRLYQRLFKPVGYIFRGGA